MSLQVVLNIYSGRSNPQWVLSRAQEVKFLDWVNQINTPTLMKPPGVIPRLGYRGFTVESSPESADPGLSLLIQDRIVDFGQTRPNRIADNRDLERFLLETATVEISNRVRNQINNELSQPSRSSAAEPLPPPPFGNCPVCQAQDAPPYNPGLWNNNFAIRWNNNCYNYANDNITNTMAQPGRAHGVFPANIDCVSYVQAATADGLAACAGFANQLGAGKGWYVALVIWPDEDFHWYRQDNDGCWSHKPGRTPVTNLDNAGNPIADPQNCDRGPYVDFCSYMVTNRGVVII